MPDIKPAPTTAPAPAPATGPDAAALVPTHRTVTMAKPLCPLGVAAVDLTTDDAERGEAIYRRAMAAGLTVDECRASTSRALKGELARWLRGVAPAPAPKAGK
jgi:hypothetical protein